MSGSNPTILTLDSPSTLETIIRLENREVTSFHHPDSPEKNCVEPKPCLVRENGSTRHRTPYRRGVMATRNI